jgi:hypothetical protein
MKLALNRRASSDGSTVGELSCEGERLCYTLEDTVREVSGMPVGNWKIKGETAIPEGEYFVTLEDSPKFGPGTLTVNGVAGFSGVRMHAGNTSEDTEGCPLLGMAIDDGCIVGGTSRPAVALVKERVRAALARGEHVMLIVRNSGEVG